MFQYLHGLILDFTVSSLMGIITVDLCPLLPMLSKPLLSFLTLATIAYHSLRWLGSPRRFKSGIYGKRIRLFIEEIVERYSFCGEITVLIDFTCLNFVISKAFFTHHQFNASM